jgi:16S rRNA (cytosine1402-N4)-methyltransferase
VNSEPASRVVEARAESVDADSMEPKIIHIPVMLEEILGLFASISKPEALVLDCTLGAGGHAEAILSRYPGVRYIGIDADPDARARASARLLAYSERLQVLTGYFDDVLEEYSRARV